MTIGGVVRTKRAALRGRAYHLAALANIPPVTLSQIENERREPTPEQTERLLSVLGQIEREKGRRQLEVSGA